MLNPAYAFTHALARRPGASVVRGLRAGNGADPSFQGVLAEHAAYVRALEEAGLAVTVLDPLEAFPDAMFVEDPALVFPGFAVVLRPGAPSRAEEGDHLRPVLAGHFGEVLDLPQGHADGGDVLAMPDRVFIGLSARTDRSGAQALVELLAARGRAAVIAETPPGVLHLKTASSLLDDETILATPELAATGIFADYRVIEVPSGEEGGANVLRLADRVLVAARYPRVAEAIAGLGLAVVPLETGEIARIDAGLTCMSLRWRAAG